MPGATLLDEFIWRQTLALNEMKHGATTTLALLHPRAAGSPSADFVELDGRLRTMIGSPELSAWFRHKVAMEWMNFVARILLGSRAEGQFTDMVGGNTIGGISDGGARAQNQWNGSDGMIEIWLTMPDRVDGLRGVAFARASVPSSYGAAQILKAAAAVDEQGQPYSMATLPVYRRVRLKTGASIASESPAFVITPEGRIESDVSNPVLAAIGAGHPVTIGELVHFAGGKKFDDEERKDPHAWSKRALTATQSIHGAHMVRELLAHIPPSVLR